MGQRRHTCDLYFQNQFQSHEITPCPTNNSANTSVRNVVAIWKPDTSRVIGYACVGAKPKTQKRFLLGSRSERSVIGSTHLPLKQLGVTNVAWVCSLSINSENASGWQYNTATAVRHMVSPDTGVYFMIFSTCLARRFPSASAWSPLK